MHGERREEARERSERGVNGVADPAQRKTPSCLKAWIGELQALQPRSRHAKRAVICVMRGEKSPASAARGALTALQTQPSTRRLAARKPG
jgi:hypothetical protein